jgi:hypothetical protein
MASSRQLRTIGGGSKSLKQVLVVLQLVEAVDEAGELDGGEVGGHADRGGQALAEVAGREDLGGRELVVDDEGRGDAGVVDVVLAVGSRGPAGGACGCGGRAAAGTLATFGRHRSAGEATMSAPRGAG